MSLLVDSPGNAGFGSNYFVSSLTLWLIKQHNVQVGGIPTRLLNLKSIRTLRENEVELGTNYQLEPHDVLCGNRNTRDNVIHTGNMRFKVLIDIRLERYRRTTNRIEKSQIVKEVVDAVRESGGNFVRCDSNMWIDIGNIKAREKAGAAIRAAIKGESPNTTTRRLSSSSSVGFASTESSDGSLAQFATDPGVAFRSNVRADLNPSEDTTKPEAMALTSKVEDTTWELDNFIGSTMFTSKLPRYPNRSMRTRMTTKTKMKNYSKQSK